MSIRSVGGCAASKSYPTGLRLRNPDWASMNCSAHDKSLFAFAQPPGAIVAIAFIDHLQEVFDAKSCGCECCTVWRHLECAHQSAKRVYIRDAGNRPQRRPNGPVEKTAPVFER